MYKIFEKLSQAREVSPYFVSKETGVAYSTITAWKQGRYHPKDDKLERIADYFDVPLAYLKGIQKDIQCPICHMGYDPVDAASIKQHQKYHDKFLAMQKHFGFTIPSRADAEQLRMDALSVLRDVKYDKFRRTSAFQDYAKYDFLCEQYDSEFGIGTTLEEYTKEQAEKLRPDNAISLNMCNEIRSEFGVDEYIEDMTVTEHEYKLICKYRELPEKYAIAIDRLFGI